MLSPRDSVLLVTQGVVHSFAMFRRDRMCFLALVLLSCLGSTEALLLCRDSLVDVVSYSDGCFVYRLETNTTTPLWMRDVRTDKLWSLSTTDGSPQRFRWCPTPSPPLDPDYRITVQDETNDFRIECKLSVLLSDDIRRNEGLLQRAVARTVAWTQNSNGQYVPPPPYIALCEADAFCMTWNYDGVVHVDVTTEYQEEHTVRLEFSSHELYAKAENMTVTSVAAMNASDFDVRGLIAWTEAELNVTEELKLIEAYQKWKHNYLTGAFPMPEFCRGWDDETECPAPLRGHPFLFGSRETTFLKPLCLRTNVMIQATNDSSDSTKTRVTSHLDNLQTEQLFDGILDNAAATNEEQVNFTVAFPEPHVVSNLNLYFPAPSNPAPSNISVTIEAGVVS